MDNTNIVGADFPDEELNAAWQRYTRRLTFERDDARGAFDAGFVVGRFGKASTPPAIDVRELVDHLNGLMDSLDDSVTHDQIYEQLQLAWKMARALRPRGTVTYVKGSDR